MLRVLRSGNKRIKALWWAIAIVTVATFIGGFIFLFGAGLNPTQRARTSGAIGTVNGQPITRTEWANALTDQRTLFQRTQYRADAFVIQRLFASYAFSNGMTVQLNIQNLFDEDYYTNVRNNVGTTLTGATANNGVVTGGWAAPGEGRSAVLSLFYSF